MKEKTSKKEQKRRITEYNKYSNLFDSFLKRIKEEKDQEKREEILESESYKNIRNIMSLGPTYIIWKKDYEDQDYRTAFGFHPKEVDILKQFYDEGYYGTLVRDEDSRDLKVYRCIAMAYDYGDYYYVVEEINNPGKYTYITMVSRVTIIKEYATD